MTHTRARPPHSMMARTLPTELLALVASKATPSAQASLARTCRSARAVAVRPLYAFIGVMNVARTIRCLQTLAHNEHLARLVRIYAVKIISSGTLGAFQVLVARALEQMENLVDLSIQLGAHTTSAVLARARFRLTRLVCIVPSDRAYPVARFLESQPGIELLHIVCREDGLDTLAPDALPALRKLSASFDLLPRLITTRLDRLVSISVPSGFFNPIGISLFATLLLNSPTRPALGTSVDLILPLDLLSPVMTPIYLEAALSHLGDCAPWIGLLRLEVHRGHVSRSILSYSITRALAHFPSLHTLVMTSPIPPPAYIRPQPQISPPHTPFIPFPPYPLNMHVNPIPLPEIEALYDTTDHLTYLQEWHAVHPGLQRVVFPIGVYTYIRNEDEARYWYGKGGCVVNFGHGIKHGVRSVRRREGGRLVGAESGGGVSFIRQSCVLFISV